jgi:hypothetical protein
VTLNFSNVFNSGQYHHAMILHTAPEGNHGRSTSRRTRRRRDVAVLGVHAAGAPPIPNRVPVAPNVVLLLTDDLSLHVMDYAASATRADGNP